MKKILLLLPLLWLLNSCEEKPPSLKVVQGDAFGTTYVVQYFSNTDIDVEKGIEEVIYNVNKSVSTYIPESDISKINRGDTTVVVDAIFKEVFRISEIVFIDSKGFFDPTVGVLRNAYGFGDEDAIQEIDEKTLDSLRQFVGFKKVELQVDGTVRKTHPQIYFDFNAVAKGYAIDLIGRYLKSQQVEHFIIELGGEVLAKGENIAKGKGWVSGVESIDSEIERRSTRALVTLADEALAASGNYRKFRIDSVTGKRYVHTINPHTGRAEQNNVTSAAVIAPSCGLADAYATAIMAMGFENAKGLLETVPGIDAYITYTSTANEPKVFVSEGFVSRLLN